jgi:hypothetical protein
MADKRRFERHWSINPTRWQNSVMATVDLGPRYLANIVRTFQNYKALAEGAIAQVPTDADLQRMLDPDSNSIVIIVKHVAGNLRSRFRDFLTTDGEKPDRQRDTEFEVTETISRDEVLKWWDAGWAIAMQSIEALTPDDLGRTVYIRGESFGVMDALNRSVTHTAYHVGQIVYLARHLASPNWQSLSIPKANPAGGRRDRA